MSVFTWPMGHERLPGSMELIGRQLVAIPLYRLPGRDGSDCSYTMAELRTIPLTSLSHSGRRKGRTVWDSLLLLAIWYTFYPFFAQVAAICCLHDVHV